MSNRIRVVQGAKSWWTVDKRGTTGEEREIKGMDSTINERIDNESATRAACRWSTMRSAMVKEVETGQ